MHKRVHLGETALHRLLSGMEFITIRWSVLHIVSGTCTQLKSLPATPNLSPRSRGPSLSLFSLPLLSLSSKLSECFNNVD